MSKYYHVSPSANRESIKREGLQTWDGPSPYLWLVDDLGLAEGMTEQHWGGATGDDLDIWEVDIDDGMLRPDPHPGGREYGGASFVSDQPISPDRIKRVAKTADVKTADKLHDFLANPKHRPDLVTEEGQAWLKELGRVHSDKNDKLLPWLTREWKKGRVIWPPQDADPNDVQDAIWQRDKPYSVIEPHEQEYRGDSGASQTKTWDRNALDHLADWLGTEFGRGTDLMQLTAQEVMGKLHDWDEYLADEERQLEEQYQQEGYSHGETVFEFPDGWSIRKLRPEEMKWEGAHMKHCVGDYEGECRSGNAQYYTLRDPEGNPHVTVEVQTQYWADPETADIYTPYEKPAPSDREVVPIIDQGTVTQIFGVANEDPKPEYKERIKKWFESIDQEVRPRSDLEENGMGGYRDDIDAFEAMDQYGLHPSEYDWDRMLEQAVDKGKDRDWNYVVRYSAPYAKQIVDLAAQVGEIPWLAKSVEQLQSKLDDDFWQYQDANWEHLQYPTDPEAFMEPGDPETWQDHGETYEEAYETVQQGYDEEQENLYSSHAIAFMNPLYEELNKYYDPQQGKYVNPGARAKNYDVWQTVAKAGDPRYNGWHEFQDDQEPPQAHYAQDEGDVPGEVDPQVPQALPEDEQGSALDPEQIYWPNQDEAIEANQTLFGLYADLFGDDPTWQGILKPNELGSALSAAQMHYSYGEQEEDVERLVIGLAKTAWKIAGSQVFGNANKRTALWMLKHSLDQNGLGWISPMDFDDVEIADWLIEQDKYGQLENAEEMTDPQVAEHFRQERDRLEQGWLDLFESRIQQGGPDPNYVQKNPEGTYITDPESMVGVEPPAPREGRTQDGAWEQGDWVQVNSRQGQIQTVRPDGTYIVYFEAQDGSGPYTAIVSHGEIAESFQGKLFSKRANILDPIHNELAPAVWDNSADPEPTLKPQHKEWITKETHRILDEAGYDNPEKWLTLIFTGSLTTYQYSDHSDVDISLFVNSDVFPEWSRAEMIGLMVGEMDGQLLPGTQYPMQCYVIPRTMKPEDLYQPGLRSGYLISEDRWIVPPDKSRVKDVQGDMTETYAYALEVADKMDRLLKYEPDKAIMFWHQVHRRRRRDQMAGKGDFSESNIAYKMLANRGYFKRISDLSGEYIA